MQRGISFEAGGRSLQLRFDVNALCRVEEATGKPFDEAAALLSPASGSPRMSDVRKIFWAGLGGDLTYDQAGVVISDIGLERAGELIGKAFELAFPEAAKQAGGVSGNGTGTAA